MESVGVLLADATSSIKGGLTAACTSACNKTDINVIFANIANALTFLIGAVAVIMIIIGGLRYVTSNGDSKQATEARQTILYAVIGVIVAIVAYAVVNFVTTYIT